MELVWSCRGWRRPFRDGDGVLEVWYGCDLIGTISPELLRALLAHHLDGAALGERVRLVLADRPRPRLLRPGRR